MSLFFAMIVFSLAMSISPGPVNMVIVSAGANYGVRKAFLLVSGATIGFTSLLVFVGLGLYKVVGLYPFFLKTLAVTGSLFIIHLGYSIAYSKSKFDVEKRRAPSFIQGFLLQWLNPKAWIASLAGVSLFSASDDIYVLLFFSFIYFIVCYLSLFSWALLGHKSTIFLNNEIRLKVFNLILGWLLIVTACFLLYSQFKGR